MSNMEFSNYLFVLVVVSKNTFSSQDHTIEISFIKNVIDKFWQTTPTYWKQKRKVKRIPRKPKISKKNMISFNHKLFYNSFVQFEETT